MTVRPNTQEQFGRSSATPSRPVTTTTSQNATSLAKSTGTPERLAALFEKLILDNGIPFDRNAAWEEAIAVLLDESSEEDIEETMRFCQSDAFWRDKVRSPAKLRQHYTELRYQSRRGKQSGRRSKPLTADAIRERVGDYRRNIAGAVVDGKPYLAPDDVDDLCRMYETKLRRRG